MLSFGRPISGCQSLVLVLRRPKPDTEPSARTNLFFFLVHPLCSQSQSVLIHEVILSQYQTSYLAFIELCMVPVISFPQTVKVHLRGITALQHIILLPLTSPVNFAISFCCFHKISVIQYIYNYKTNVIYKISSSVLLFELTLL